MIGLQNPFTCFSQRTVIFSNSYQNSFLLFNFNVYSNSLKDSNFTSQQWVVYQNTLLHTESFTKVFLHQGRCSIDHVHIRTTIPCLVWITVISRKLYCHWVCGKIGVRQRRKFDLMNAHISLWCLEWCLDLKWSGGKRKERNLTK